MSLILLSALKSELLTSIIENGRESNENQWNIIGKTSKGAYAPNYE